MIVALFLVATFSGSTFRASAASVLPFTVHTHTGSTEGFLSNSYLIETKKNVIVIDAQFFPQGAKNVAGLAGLIGKRLSKIVITHPHPDHYYGLEALGAQYNKAEILGGPITIDEVRKSLKFWADKQAVEDIFGPTRVLSVNGATLNDIGAQTIILNDGESVENTVIFFPSQQILFVGDLASNGIHMWLAEGRLENWLAQLKFLRSLENISAIYPGHGPVGGVELLEDAEKYITDFQNLIRTSSNVELAIAAMRSLYPEYKMPEILEASIRSVMASKKHVN